ncbi:hypothetical protein SAMN05660226_01055 [Parapedobacter luteus]|uniref:Esterase-like activity of phytase n=1 Tax=Parapedobacter luteus TaxID=623280 RepID=A0A1T5AUN7_9SPHI|nr:hypothetical protein [Parapedobacter luteus]SKB38303.1 hypothetical protein SAMN05660226_01055 [Parapedobacter luteus]
MNGFYLQALLKIVGISAASGITFSDGLIRLVSDNSNYLYEYPLDTGQLTRYLLKDGEHTEQVAKAWKMDLEAIVERDDATYVFGSGSTPARELGFAVSKTDRRTDTLQLHALYDVMRSAAGIGPDDFNIEGVAVYGADWLFLNRGNGPGGRNVLFTVHGPSLTENPQVSYEEIDLPMMDGLPFGFSDATVAGDTLFFIATAEAGQSTYHDGEVGGSLFGAIDLGSRKLLYSRIISRTHKFEGIARYPTETGSVAFLLCEDDDSTTDTTTIYRLDVDRSWLAP